MWLPHSPALLGSPFRGLLGVAEPQGGLSTVHAVTSVVQGWEPREKRFPAWAELASNPEPKLSGSACPCTLVQSWSSSAEILPFHPADPDWASYKLGIFICLYCSGVHRNFPDISKVKSVRLDFWDDSMVEVEWHVWIFGVGCGETGHKCTSCSTEEKMKPREVQRVMRKLRLVDGGLDKDSSSNPS